MDHKIQRGTLVIMGTPNITPVLLFMLPVILLGWIPVIGIPLGIVVGFILFAKFAEK